MTRCGWKKDENPPQAWKRSMPNLQQQHKLYVTIKRKEANQSTRYCKQLDYGQTQHRIELEVVNDKSKYALRVAAETLNRYTLTTTRRSALN
eukprot:scaffold414172_cov15-Prasinocladus_malaysianus.AAC.1